jgi:ATP-dependent RNA helicase RhlB
MSLPDIEDYIGHKIPVASFTEKQLPEIVKPKGRPRRNGPPRHKSGGGRGKGGGGRRSSRQRSG